MNIEDRAMLADLARDLGPVGTVIVSVLMLAATLAVMWVLYRVDDES